MSVLLRKVQIYINFKTVNGFKYKMDYSILIVSMCIEKSTRIKGLKTEDVLTKMPKNLAFLFWAKNGQKSGSKFKKMAQKKSDWRKWWRKKKNPSANPAWGQKWSGLWGHRFYIGFYGEKHEKIFLSETTGPRALIFGMNHHLDDLYQVCSN